MADSYEKRKRNRKKQLKREEKLLRRKQRREGGGSMGLPTLSGQLVRFEGDDAEPEDGTEREGAKHHILRRLDGDAIQVDTGLWLCVLDLALARGWKPMGTTDPDEELEESSGEQMRWEPGAYFLPFGQTIQDSDCGELGKRILLALEHVDDDEVMARDGAFGKTNTLSSVAIAMGGDPVPEKNSTVAYELLGGAPKEQAALLAEFLIDGKAVTIQPQVQVESNDVV